MKLHKLLIIIILFFCFSVYANNENNKENIIFIIVDDLRELTMADNQLEILTPNIDKLKKNGVTFKIHLQIIQFVELQELVYLQSRPLNLDLHLLH